MDESKNRLASMAELLPYGVVLLHAPTDSPDDMVLVYANREAEIRSPVNLKEARTKPLRSWLGFAFTDSEDSFPNLAFRAAVHDEFNELTEFSFGPDPDDPGWYRINLIPVGDRHVAIMMVNVRADRQARLQLRESEKRFRRFIEETSDLVVRLEPDGRISFANDSAHHFLGLPPEACVGENIDTFFHPDERTRSRRVYRDWRARRETDATFENRLVSRAGVVHNILWTVHLEYTPEGRARSMHAIAHDITERKAIEEALRRSEKKYLDLYDQSPDMYLSIELDSANVIECNRTTLRMLGYERHEVLGRPVTDFYAQPCLVQARAALERFRETGELRDVELRVLRRDGALIDVSLNAGALADESGRFTVGRLSWRNISERKRIERELLRAKDTAEAASRAKSEFLAGMSHELRTPLNAVIGFSQILSNKSFGDLNAKQERYVQGITTSGWHLLRLIDDILDLSKVEAGRMDLELEPVDFAALVESSTIVIRERAFGRRITLDVRISPELRERRPRVDERKIKQVLYNLLSNAVKFTPDGGSITIEAAVSGRDLRVSVSDTGIGIAAENLERVFGAFERIDTAPSRVYEGTGLGLALSTRLVELHGGRIRAMSDGEGRGSCFEFTIPLLEPNQSATVINNAPFRAMAAPAVGRSSQVLVVEDDESAYELLAQYLTNARYEVLRARDGEEALSVARDAIPGAILLDMMLPKIDGMSVLAGLKMNPPTSEIPVVVISVAEKNRLAQTLGAEEWFVKPVDEAELLHTLERLIGPAPAARAQA